MALTQVTGPYPIFTDLDGTPLDDGYLYIGVINQDPEQNPIQVFWDSNLTIPATQPIRTSNGYAYRNGTPALLYTAGEFSITIRNKREEFVLYSPVGYGFDPAAVSASVVRNDFTGDGVTVNFTLSAAPSTILATNIFINGVYQEKDSYTLAGNVITFSVAPPLGSSIEVLTNETGVIGLAAVSANETTCILQPAALGNSLVKQADEQFGDGLALVGVNDRDFNAFQFNPLSSFRPSFPPIEIIDVYQEVSWYAPKLKNGQLLAVPVSEGADPDCVYFVKDVSRNCEIVDYNKAW